MPKVVLKGFILVPDADLAAVKQELPHHIQLTRQEPGCLVFDVSQSAEKPERFDVYEEFIDRASFDAHQERARNSTWADVSKNATRHFQIE